MRGRVLLAFALLLAPALLGSAAATHEDSREPVLVSLDTWPPPTTTERAFDARGVHVVDEVEAFQVLLVESPVSPTTLEHAPHVAYAVEDEQLSPHLDESKPAIGLSTEMHEAGLTGEGVNIALVDSGVDQSHAGLDDRIVLEKTITEDGARDGPSEPSEHGTHVAGVLAGTGEASPQDQGDVSGVAPGSGVVSLDISEQFTTSNALRAFEWVYEHHEEEDIQVLVNAWGRERAPAEYEPDDPLVRASDALVEEDVVVVFSAGNAGPEEGRMTVEGTNPNVITVGASDKQGEVENYSSRGPVYEDGEPADWVKPDVIAPGSKITSTAVSGNDEASYSMMNGTSMAAPHVAGAAALMLSLRPDLSPGEVKGVLLEGATPVGSEEVDHRSGHGLLDVSGSVEILEQSGENMAKRSTSESQRGELTGPSQTRGLLQEASVDDEDRMSIEVPQNATRLEADISWGGDSGLQVDVVDPRGAVAKSVHVDGEEHLHVSEPRAGTWWIEMEPEPSDRGSYEVTAEVTWLVEGETAQIPIADQRTQSGSFPSTGQGLSPLASTWIPGVPNVVPMIAGALLTVAMIAGRWRRGAG